MHAPGSPSYRSFRQSRIGVASGEASERSKATGGYVTLGLQWVAWRRGRQIARDDAHAFPPEVAVSGGADHDTTRLDASRFRFWTGALGRVHRKFWLRATRPPCAGSN